MTAHDHAGAPFVSALATGFIVSIPESALPFLGKVASVFLLAVVGEIGRRLVNRFWKSNK